MGAGPSGGALASAVSKEGALGFIAAGHFQESEDDFLRDQLRIFRENDASNKLRYSSLGTDQGWQRYEAFLKEHRPAVVQFFTPAVVRDSSDRTNIDVAHDHNALVITQVGTTRDAIAAASAGADAISLRGVRQVDTGYAKEVLWDPAGGVSDGADLVAALVWGCDGVVLGTRLFATKQALGKESYKRALEKASFVEDVHRTTVFDQIQNSYSSVPWPKPYDSMGTLENETSRAWKGESEQTLADELNSGAFQANYRQAQLKGDIQVVPVLAGQGVVNIHSIESADDVIRDIDQQARDMIQTTLPFVIAETSIL